MALMSRSNKPNAKMEMGSEGLEPTTPAVFRHKVLVLSERCPNHARRRAHATVAEVPCPDSRRSILLIKRIL
jgi:hypothetical protein